MVGEYVVASVHDAHDPSPTLTLSSQAKQMIASTPPGTGSKKTQLDLFFESKASTPSASPRGLTKLVASPNTSILALLDQSQKRLSKEHQLAQAYILRMSLASLAETRAKMSKLQSPA